MTKSDDKRVPALRFKGFTDDWEQRKPGDFLVESKIIGHKGDKAKKLTVKLWGKGVQEKQDILSGSANTQYYIRKSGQLMYGKLDFLHAAFGIVPSQLNNYESTIDSPSFDVKSANSIFLLNLFLRKKFYLYYGERANGSRKAKRIHEKDFLVMPIKMPEINEQNKISNLIEIVNNRITLQQRKLRQLKLLKNALLKRMFTAKKSPTLRFRDFSKDWKLHKLQDITDRLDNARVPVTASKRIAGSTPYYGANGIQDYVKGYTHDGEFLLVAEDGANNINDYPVICAKGKIWVNNHAHVLQAKNKKIDILFLMYALKFLNMKKYLVGGSRSKLNAETMMKLALKLPELDEEHNIGVLIKNMDVLITQYKYRIQKINKFKQFLLQNMFI
mgnify:CR=1 FL=1